MKYLSALFLILFLSSCQTNNKKLTATDIINKSITVAGGDKFDTSAYSFQFRDKMYRADRNKGLFSISREFLKDSVGFIEDYVTNNGFERFIDKKMVSVADTTANKLSASVNSVHYFSVLPYGLNSEAVKKELLGIVSIKDVPYHKIKVTFNEEGGGEDFEDEFIYWINIETFKVDYLAYSYKEVDGSLGLRFREAYNERYVGDLRFVDYNNYKSETEGVSVEDLDDLFQKDLLKLLSKIKLENITMGSSLEENQ
ncbi:deoxyribose-phosphate aldolase [Bizionia argentinensis JUB59]|uniref:Deoxyribose-phosphate aldolase n=1 Tax=Bizionia argentinensis JUB59 TaxID=1046627 RepID=G2EGR7_9FLAO|nr:DUF6503 family protein [Bizionia argentinensis]EGV42393.2 deoxyribose-phosphate aldolase [Bizionia argentinensis JUB59]